MTPRKIILCPMGSAGDVHPLIWLGKQLLKRGHDIVMVVQAFGMDMPQKAGIRTLSVGNREEQEAVLHNKALWDRRKGFDLLAEHIPKWALPVMDAIKGEVEPGRTLMIAGGIAIGARMASEKWNIPLITVQLQPSVFMSADKPPVMAAGMEWFPKLPRPLRKVLFHIAHWKIDSAMRKPINDVRASVGITHPPVRHVFKWWNSPDGVIALFPDWFAPKTSDWPAQTVNTRFPLYDESEDSPPTAEEQTLMAEENGFRPIIITPGSANAQAKIFIQNAIDACGEIPIPAVVITNFPEQLPNPLPSHVRAAKYIPFSRVFPLASAVIHHGGIGTTAQCLAAGVPQMVMPMAHDQPDNASRIQNLGVGDYLYPEKFHPLKVAEKLHDLLDSPTVTTKCESLKEKMAHQMTGEQVAQLIEEMGERAITSRRSKP